MISLLLFNSCSYVFYLTMLLLHHHFTYVTTPVFSHSHTSTVLQYSQLYSYIYYLLNTSLLPALHLCFLSRTAVSGSVRILGPVCGYSLAAWSLSLWVSPSDTPPVQPRHPQWIGAWWIGERRHTDRQREIEGKEGSPP